MMLLIFILLLLRGRNNRRSREEGEVGEGAVSVSCVVSLGAEEQGCFVGRLRKGEGCDEGLFGLRGGRALGGPEALIGVVEVDKGGVIDAFAEFGLDEDLEPGFAHNFVVAA